MIPKTAIVLIVAIGLFAVGAAYEICQKNETGTFHRDYSTCQGYFACSRGKSYPAICPDELLYNEKKSSCDFPFNVKCGLACPETGNTGFRFSNSCVKYISCVRGKGSYMECPTRSLFDDKKRTCQPMVLAECSDKNIHCPDPRVNNKFPSKEKCSAYYQCVNGRPTLMECANGLHYNIIEQSCDSPASARCPIVANKKENVSDIEIECPTEGTHFFPHPMNCHLYHICHNGVVRKMLCGRRLYYDIITKRCEQSKRARCVVDALKNNTSYLPPIKPKDPANATIPTTLHSANANE